MGPDELEMELAAISISIAAGCIPCTRHHITESDRLGAKAESVLHAVRVGAAVADAGLMQVWQKFDADAKSVSPGEERQFTSRQALLCGLGSAVARNNVDQLKAYIKHSRIAGIDDVDSMAVVGLAERIKEKAASHLERIVTRLDADRSIARNAARLCT